MNRTPPGDVRRQLRQEVGFGCPIAGCRSPFLMYHHFDPPWTTKEHHNPNGMIALCPEHHGEADGNHFSIVELRALKSGIFNAVDVKGRFPSWQKREVLVRLGGSYSGGHHSVITVRSRSLVTLDKNDHGTLSLSFELRDQAEDVVLAMEKNDLIAYPERLHDLEATARKKHIKLWHAARQIGLELSFDRIDLAGLDRMLASDREGHLRRRVRQIQSAPFTGPEHLRERDAAYRRELIECAQAQHSDSARPDYIAADVREWATDNCTDEDGLIPFLDFNTLRSFSGGYAIDIHHGVCGLLGYSCTFDNAGGGIAIG